MISNWKENSWLSLRTSATQLEKAKWPRLPKLSFLKTCWIKVSQQSPPSMRPNKLWSLQVISNFNRLSFASLAKWQRELKTEFNLCSTWSSSFLLNQCPIKFLKISDSIWVSRRTRTQLRWSSKLTNASWGFIKTQGMLKFGSSFYPSCTSRTRLFKLNSSINEHSWLSDHHPKVALPTNK